MVKLVNRLAAGSAVQFSINGEPVLVPFDEHGDSVHLHPDTARQIAEALPGYTIVEVAPRPRETPIAGDEIASEDEAAAAPPAIRRPGRPRSRQVGT